MQCSWWCEGRRSSSALVTTVPGGGENGTEVGGGDGDGFRASAKPRRVRLCRNAGAAILAYTPYETAASRHLRHCPYTATAARRRHHCL